uniref:NADH dehydrogenase subunit 6 n=1 Tax=Acrobeloides nanus TaxID=290746 RepID=A0A914D365_9BILA
MNLGFAYPLLLVIIDVRLRAVFPGLIMLMIFCVGIVIFTVQTKYGLLSYVGVICQILIALIAFGIVTLLNIFVLKMEFIVTIYALILLLVGIIYLMISIQLIMNGQRGDITGEDYVFAEVKIFLDIACAIMILMIFIFVIVGMLLFCYFGISIVRIPLWRSGNTTTNNDNTTV